MYISSSILELKISRLTVVTDMLKQDYLEFIPRQSNIKIKSKKNMFSTLKYGGEINNYIVVVTIKVCYDKDISEEKLEEYALDLLEDNILVNQIKPILEAIPNEII